MLAKYTDNVLDELWNYIEDGKIVRATILLLAAQCQLRDMNGFVTIKNRIMNSTALLNIEIKGLAGGKRSKSYKQLMEKKTFLENSAGMVVVIIDRIGELLDTYVQTHPKVLHFYYTMAVMNMFIGRPFIMYYYIFLLLMYYYNFLLLMYYHIDILNPINNIIPMARKRNITNI